MKRILTFAVCMAMSAPLALANTTATSTMKLTTQQSAKEVAPKAGAAVPCPCQSNASETQLSKEQLRQKFEEKMTKRRDALYCKLGLTPEQKAKAVELDTKNRTEAKPFFDKIQEERTKLMELKAKNACPVELIEQKQKLRAAKKELRKHFMASEKNFEALLTKEQLTKLQAIRAENKAKFKKHCKCKGHGHHKQPQMLEPTAK